MQLNPFFVLQLMSSLIRKLRFSKLDFSPRRPAKLSWADTEFESQNKTITEDFTGLLSVVVRCKVSIISHVTTVRHNNNRCPPVSSGWILASPSTLTNRSLDKAVTLLTQWDQ